MYLVRHGNRQDVFCMVSVVDIIQLFCMVSVVGCLWFSSSQETLLWFPSLVFNGFRRGRKTFVYGFRRWICGGFCRRRRIQNVIIYRAIPRCLLCF